MDYFVFGSHRTVPTMSSRAQARAEQQRQLMLMARGQLELTKEERLKFVSNYLHAHEGNANIACWVGELDESHPAHSIFFFA